MGFTFEVQISKKKKKKQQPFLETWRVDSTWCTCRHAKRRDGDQTLARCTETKKAVHPGNPHGNDTISFSSTFEIPIFSSVQRHLKNLGSCHNLIRIICNTLFRIANQAVGSLVSGPRRVPCRTPINVELETKALQQKEAGMYGCL